MNGRIRAELAQCGSAETRTFKYWLDERIEAMEDNKDLCRHVIYIFRRRWGLDGENELCGVWSEELLNVKEV